MMGKGTGNASNSPGRARSQAVPVSPRCGRLCALIGLCIVTAMAGGCSTAVVSPQRPDAVIVVPGIGGDGRVYAQVIQSLQDHHSPDCLQVFDWGYGWPLFFSTISSTALHRHAECQLADLLIQRRKEYPHARIVLIAHSAGAGVAVGALARLPGDMKVGPIILLAPALSPDFDLRPALKHANIVHVFYSPSDAFWQGLGPIIFGNYDGIHRDGAGRRGFSLMAMNSQQKTRIVQHPYMSRWQSLGNDGGHFDWMAQPFVALVLKPLIDANPPENFSALASDTLQSFAVNPR